MQTVKVKVGGVEKSIEVFTMDDAKDSAKLALIVHYANKAWKGYRVTGSCVVLDNENFLNKELKEAAEGNRPTWKVETASKLATAEATIAELQAKLKELGM